jgi:diaminopimelate epimerase
VADARSLRGGVLRIATDAGLRTVEVGPPDGAEVQVSVDMGLAGPGPEVPGPVAERLGTTRFGTADLGNPHLVVQVPDATGVDPAVDGPWLEAQFPEGVNVEFVSLAADAGAAEPTIDLRVWERGVGVTEACGTGACAATALAASWGLIEDRARVAMPGGTAAVVVRPDGGVTLVGPSVRIATIEWVAP